MWTLFRSLIVRSLLRDPLRSLITVIAVALGIAVVIAIDLAGDAAAGSFQNSLTTVVGKIDLEILANGGVDEQWIGRLAGLPMNARFSPGLEATIKISPVGYVTVYGVDAIAETQSSTITEAAADCGEASPAFVTQTLATRLPSRFQIHGHAFCVARTFESKQADFIAIDIAAMQQALGRYGKLDRIDVFIDKRDDAKRDDFESVEHAIRAAVPSGYQVTRPGTRSAENQKMLRAFRWNLRILSYIALVVGAFLIYNTISISVVRRRPEIGILRALGASRHAILAMFLLESALFGFIGAALGLILGRALAVSMVSIISQTIQALYTSSTPSPIHLTLVSVCVAFGAGLAVSLISAWAPAREAMRIVPTEAMGRGSREVRARMHLTRNFLVAVALAGLACAASYPGPIDGRPVFGYLATLLCIAVASLIAPAVILSVSRLLQNFTRRILGAEGLLASRSLESSLSRTAVVVAALATAIAMMASVGIMVSSFRDTLLSWLDSELRADIYIGVAGPNVAGQYPPIDLAIIKILRGIPGIDDIDTFTALELRYGGERATLGAGDLRVQRRHGSLNFLSGNHDAILDSLPNADRAIVSEPFSHKHHVHVGDRITIPLGEKSVTVTVAGIYYEYSSEQGYVILDRSTLLKYLPNQPPTNIAVYLKANAKSDVVLDQIRRRTSQFPIVAAPNAELRRESVIIFDRTFAVTWALEGVAILVAMLGAANSLLGLVLDRRREFGMLRYLGAAVSQIRRIILVEAGLLGLFALILGLLLGLVLSLLLIYVINKQSFGWTIQFHLPVQVIGGAMVLIWFFTLLAGLYPAHVAANLKPIEVIHEE